MFTIIGEAIKHHLFSRFAIVTLSFSVVTCARGQRRMSFRGSDALEHEVGQASCVLKNPTHSALSSIQGLLMPIYAQSHSTESIGIVQGFIRMGRTAEEECGD